MTTTRRFSRAAIGALLLFSLAIAALLPVPRDPRWQARGRARSRSPLTRCRSASPPPSSPSTAATASSARRPRDRRALPRQGLLPDPRHGRETLQLRQGSRRIALPPLRSRRGFAWIGRDPDRRRVTIYTAEELLAMILNYGMSLADSHARVPVKDVVITVPPYFGQAERRAMVQAAQLAGINVLSLVNEHAGAALQYAIDNDFSNGLAIIKEFGKTVPVNMLQVKDVRWNSRLGVRTWKCVWWIESLYNDVDFRSTITREKFEELCVELIGGATRVPKLQAKLQEFLGRDSLDKHLDADEAIALGASLVAANLSDGIKLNRKLGLVDGSPYGFVLDIDGPDYVKDETTDLLLVPRLKKMPIKMFRSIKHNKDFDVSLSYDRSGELPPGVSSYTFAQYSVSGLRDASEKYATRNLSAPIKANLHFSLSRSGIVSLDRAEALIEITEWVEVPKKNVSIESNSTSNLNISAEAGSTNDGSTDKATPNSENGTNHANSTTDENNIAEVATEKVLKKRTFRVPLKVVEKTEGPGAALGKEEKIEDNTEIEKVSTEQERQSFVDKLSEVQEWLYMDGEDAQATEFEDRLESLKAIGDPIFFRLSELTARPTACEHARTYLSELQKIVSNWEANKPWLPRARIDEVLSEAEKLKSWLEEKEALQKNTPAFTTPVFTSEEVYTKVFKLQDKVASVNRIPKPKPKIEKPPKEESASKDNTTADETPSTETDLPPSEDTVDPKTPPIHNQRTLTTSCDLATTLLSEEP
uniref:Heat shock 70 kDa protein 17 n=1 Tax=Ananas comosus var. bracteatus TaxID=296719 RepID=A0A6V7Q4Y3_ANACO|nr:unnamed protein product [Ananas comosus var. bracteatus]